MESPSPPEAQIRTRIRQQEVVADLGQRAPETDDIGQSMHDAATAVAGTLDDECAEGLELLSGGDEVLLRRGVGWVDSEPGDGATFSFTLPAAGDVDE